MFIFCVSFFSLCPFSSPLILERLFTPVCLRCFFFAGLLQGTRTRVCVCLHLHASSQILEHLFFFFFLMLCELIERRWQWVRSMKQLSFWRLDFCTPVVPFTLTVLSSAFFFFFTPFYLIYGNLLTLLESCTFWVHNGWALAKCFTKERWFLSLFYMQVGGWKGPFAILCFSLSLSHWGSALFGFLPCGNSSRTGCVSVCAQSCVRSSTWACNQQQKSLQGESFGLRGTKLSIIVVLWTFTFFSLSLSLCQLFFFFF